MKQQMMKWGLLVAAALVLLWPAPSGAQTNPQPSQTNKSGPAKPGAHRHHRPAAKPNRPAVKPGKPAAKPTKPAPSRPAVKPHRPRPPQAGKPGRPPSAGRPGHRPPQTAARPRPPRRDQFFHRGGWFGRIRAPAYAYPPGWRYRQWTIGLRLPPILFGPSYYYSGWAPLGLEEPLPGYQWVRFGPDLLLVNLRTGEVEDVVYGVFY